MKLYLLCLSHVLAILHIFYIFKGKLSSPFLYLWFEFSKIKQKPAPQNPFNEADLPISGWDS